MAQVKKHLSGQFAKLKEQLKDHITVSPHHAMDTPPPVEAHSPREYATDADSCTMYAVEPQGGVGQAVGQAQGGGRGPLRRTVKGAPSLPQGKRLDDPASVPSCLTSASSMPAQKLGAHASAYRVSVGCDRAWRPTRHPPTRRLQASSTPCCLAPSTCSTSTPSGSRPDAG